MLTVGDVMTTSVVTVKASTPLKAVAEILIERGISGVPVVDDAGMVVGVVSEADFCSRSRARRHTASPVWDACWATRKPRRRAIRS